jgi:NADH dehydrogenase
MQALDAVTGAFGYSGRHIAERLLDQGVRVRSLTGHPDRPDPFGGRVEVRRLDFEDGHGLRTVLAGVRVLYNTYWVRFARGATTHERAVRNSERLFDAAAAAGVERIVHVSITNPSPDSRLPYFRGKALVEQALAATALPHAILRPAVFFGGRDVLINNIAWLLRRSPAFGIVPGDYALRPIHVEDFAALAIEYGAKRKNATIDAVGPETLRFAELVRIVRQAVGSRAMLVPMPPAALLAASAVVGAAVGDVVLTPDEVAGLRANLLVTNGPATGSIRLTEWLERNGATLGREYASELGRHLR